MQFAANLTAMQLGMAICKESSYTVQMFTCMSPLLPRIGFVQSSSLIRSEMGSLPPGISPLSQNQSKSDVLSSALRFLPFVSSSCACS